MTESVPGRRVAIVQSCYIPWKGYFDLIRDVDEFILYDDRQFTRRDWRNRNKIKTKDGVRWLTIPVESKGRYFQRIDETRVQDPGWAESHWQTLRHAYAAAPCFGAYADVVAGLYREAAAEPYLSKVNRHFLEALCGVLGIDTRLSWSTDYPATGDRTERLVSLCRAAGATAYLSGPAARAYLDLDAFSEAGIEVEFADYSGYPEYPQLHPPFEHGVTILDLLFNVGADAPRFLKPMRPVGYRGE